MRNTLLCISVFSIPLCAMELPEPGPDAALVNNAVDIITAALGTQNLNGQSSSLQDSCAKAIVHNWHAVLKKKAMTAEALLDKLAAHNILEKFEHALICPNNLPYPTSIARDADMAVYDFEHAVLSDDGRWAIGWVKSKNQGGMLARFDLYSCDMHNNKRTLCLEGAYLGNLNYVFLSNNSVLLRDKDSLYECGAKEFFEKGYDALKRVFTRIDGKKYGHPFFCNSLEVLSPSKVVCVGPQENCLEVMNKDESGWKCTTIIKLLSEIRYLCIARMRQFAITIEKDDWGKMNFYDLSEQKNSFANLFLGLFSTVQHCGSISIPDLYTKEVYADGGCSYTQYPDAGTLSPDETMVIRGTLKGEICIIDCTDIAKPFVAATIDISSGSPITDVLWNSFVMCVKDNCKKRYDPKLVPLMSVAAYKKKLEEAPKQGDGKAEANNDNA